MPVFKVVCPRCRAVLKTSKPLAVGKSVKCPQCGEPFTVSADQGAPAAAGPAPVAPVPSPITAPAPPQPGTVSYKRLAGVVAGAVVFLTAGAGLAAYCFSGRQPSAPASQETAPPPPAPAETALITLSPEEQVPIDQAIIAGVRYLKTSQGADGKWEPAGDNPVGYAALPGLVLLDCGLPPDDPNVRKAAEFVRRTPPLRTKTYDTALAILFLDRLADSKDRPLIQSLALRLAVGQTPTGTWGYDIPILKPEEEQQVVTLLNSLGNESLADWSQQHPEESAHLLPAWKGKLAALQDVAALNDEHFKNYSGDNSTTQFAILGLWAARRYDLPLDRTMALMVRHFRATQNKDGGWNYNPGKDDEFPSVADHDRGRAARRGHGPRSGERGQGGGQCRGRPGRPQGVHSAAPADRQARQTPSG